MILPRVIAFVMISSSAAVQAQQTPAAPAPSQPAATTSIAKPDNSQKVTCRISMEGNMPKRTCMANSEWKKLDGQAQNGLDQSYINRQRCNSMGAC